MNHWEWEGMGLKKIFPLISAAIVRRPHRRQEILRERERVHDKLDSNDNCIQKKKK